MEEEESKLVEERRQKLRAIRAAGNAYPNDFRRLHLAADLHRGFAHSTKEELEKARVAATVAGRMMLKRVMGKASFATLQDSSGRIQIYVSNEVENYEPFKHWDLGDILGVEGTLFKTMKGELTVNAKKYPFWRKPCALFRRSSTASPTTRCATASATSISS